MTKKPKPVTDVETEADLTEALEESFPASDPPSMTQPHCGPERHEHGKSKTGVEAELARQQAKKVAKPPR
jgi:hypothetical protein